MLLAVLVLLGAAAFVPDANMERAAIPAEFKWKLDPLATDDAAFDAGLARAAADVKRLEAFRGRLGEPARLRECLDRYFATRLALNKLTVYAGLRLATEQQSTALQALSDRGLRAMNDFMGAAGFIRQEVLKLDDPALAEAYRREPALAAYRPYLDELRRRRARVLSPEAERVLALAGDNLWAEMDLNELPSDHEKTARSLLATLPLPKITDAGGAPVQLTLSNYARFRASDDRRVRLAAVDGLFGALRRVEQVAAGTFAGQVHHSIFLARARGYPTALEAYLDRDNIDPAVYRTLVRTIRANLAPLHRYVALRKRVMQLPEVRLADLYPPLVAQVRMDVSFAQAARLLPEALAPLGPEYLRVLTAGLDPKNGWLDLYPHRDKESGAFAAGTHGVHPFVKMNYFDEYDGLSTLAHEYGHALHSHLSMTTQPYVTSGYVPFVAEVASTFNEKMLSDHLLARAASRAEKLFLLNELVDMVRTTIYRQTLFAEFELAAHTAAENGTPLTAEWLSRTYAELVRAYYGPDFAPGPDDGVEWAYIPHLYYKFYVFSYATGLSSGIALAEKVRSGGPAARDAYLGLLRGGCSKPPLQLLRNAGVDLTRPDVFESAARLMDRSLEQMEALLAPPAR